MKKINAILSNSTKEQYPVLINKLSDIIEPFALHAVGLPPVYVGLEVEVDQLTVKQSGESVYVFGINGKDVAHVEGILENIPRELKPLLGAAIMVSKLRKGEITKEGFKANI